MRQENFCAIRIHNKTTKLCFLFVHILIANWEIRILVKFAIIILAQWILSPLFGNWFPNFLQMYKVALWNFNELTQDEGRAEYVKNLCTSTFNKDL